eukprot:5051847-Prymnesium_polylepis.1
MDSPARDRPHGRRGTRLCRRRHPPCLPARCGRRGRMARGSCVAPRRVARRAGGRWRVRASLCVLGRV